ncbi:hypothetical protein BT96DRAFT_1000871 [Gymnopus androsaceus JB14]|uniref:Uncharacterized protein n=1 Tax=Gymnopus androsaceus JB14 TaxID=1447944 RepID=A0A6A4H0Y9_9AGAR|nr:hypothetical protein BT96DRAFT_1000871 [Gymnopus androsaceus JB14]
MESSLEVKFRLSAPTDAQRGRHFTSQIEAAEYSGKPASHATVSEKYFADLLFSKASNISLPDLAPKGTLSGWVFDSHIPSNAAAAVILPQDIIPHIDDLIPITRDMQFDGKAFRSVDIEFG